MAVADPCFGVRGAHFFLGFHIAPPPPLRGFPEATIQVYTWILSRISNCTPPPPWTLFLRPLYKYIPGFFRISICTPLDQFSWSHYKSLYLDFLGFRLAHIFFWSHYKRLYLDFLGFRFAHTPLSIFSEANIKVYTPWNKGGGARAPPEPPPPPWIRHCMVWLQCDWSQ